jgi:hypothetical protein
MATSVVTTLNGVFSNEGTPGIRSDVWSTATNDYERVGQFGFNPLHGAAYPEVNSTNQTEDVATVDQSFYVNYTGSPLSPQSSLLDSRVLNTARPWLEHASLRLNSALVEGPYQVGDYFDATSYSSQGGRVPYYNLSRIKLENVGMNDMHEFESLAPATTFDIHAFVYAQQGSWLVLPNDWYDGAVRNNTDLNATEYSHALSRLVLIAIGVTTTKSIL